MSLVVFSPLVHYDERPAPLKAREFSSIVKQLMGFWTETVRMMEADGKTCSSKNSIWNFALMGYLTGRSGEERPDAQVNRLATHAHTHSLTHTNIQYWSPL